MGHVIFILKFDLAELEKQKINLVWPEGKIIEMNNTSYYNFFVLIAS